MKPDRVYFDDLDGDQTPLTEEEVARRLEVLKRRHYKEGCVYQIDTCSQACRQKYDEVCRLGVPVLRNRWRGDAGHHHFDQFQEET